MVMVAICGSRGLALAKGFIDPMIAELNPVVASAGTPTLEAHCCTQYLNGGGLGIRGKLCHYLPNVPLRVVV
jgi:hypothetical protein